MPKKGTPRDKNLDCLAVIAYKDIIHLQANYLQRAEIAEKIQCTERGLSIWRGVLRDHMLRGWNPKNIPFMLKQWEGIYYDPARSDPCWEDRSSEQVAETWRD